MHAANMRGEIASHSDHCGWHIQTHGSASIWIFNSIPSHPILSINASHPRTLPCQSTTFPWAVSPPSPECLTPLKPHEPAPNLVMAECRLLGSYKSAHIPAPSQTAPGHVPAGCSRPCVSGPVTRIRPAGRPEACPGREGGGTEEGGRLPCKSSCFIQQLPLNGLQHCWIVALQQTHNCTI